MAIILSHVWAEVRGSIAGITYFPNQYHQIVARARTAPVNPNTTRQQQIRGAFDDASELWKSFPSTFHDQWDQYSDGCVFPGPLGDYTIPGRQMFIRNVGIHMYLTSRDAESFPTSPTSPLDFGFNTLSGYVVTPLAAPGIGFTLTGVNNNPRNNTIYGFRSRPFNPSRVRFKGPFLTETIYPINAPPAAPVVIPWTGLIDGAAYFVKLRSISDFDVPNHHRLSFAHVIRAIATTTA